MKKLFFPALAVCALMFASCSTITKTSTALDVDASAVSRSDAGLTVSPIKITYKFYPEGSVRKAGLGNVKSTAVAEALKENGNADVLVAPQYEIKSTTNLFGRSNVKYVIVTGYPATYTSFRPAK